MTKLGIVPFVDAEKELAYMIQEHGEAVLEARDFVIVLKLMRVMLLLHRPA